MDFVLTFYLASLQRNYDWLGFVEHEMIVLHGPMHFWPLNAQPADHDTYVMFSVAQNASMLHSLYVVMYIFPTTIIELHLHYLFFGYQHYPLEQSNSVYSVHFVLLRSL